MIANKLQMIVSQLQMIESKLLEYCNFNKIRQK